MSTQRFVPWTAVFVLAIGSVSASEVGSTPVAFPDGKNVDLRISGTQRAPAAEISAKAKHQSGQSAVDMPSRFVRQPPTPGQPAPVS